MKAKIVKSRIIGIRVTEGTRKKIIKLAKKRKTTITGIVGEALDAFLDQEVI